MNRLPANASKTQRELFILLTSLFPSHDIRPEYSVADVLRRFWVRANVDDEFKDSSLLIRSKGLHFDFYDVTANKAYEVQGNQHNEFNPYFHQTLAGFDSQKLNDITKKAVCNEAGVELIEIPAGTVLNEELIKSYYD